jgi:hypothetical protein
MSAGINRLDFASLLEQLDKDGILTVHSSIDNEYVYARGVSFNSENNTIEIEFSHNKEEATTVQRIMDTCNVINGNIQVRLQGFDMDWDIDQLEDKVYSFYRRGKFHL